MGDAYWRYGDPRQPLQPNCPPLVGKRPRLEGGQEAAGGYYPLEVERGPILANRDSDSIAASYDRYLRSTQVPSYGGAHVAGPMGGVLPGPAIDGRHVTASGIGEPIVINRAMGFGGGGTEVPLPPDATNTLFVEGLPPNCRRREVAHIFRPFVGYREVRIVTKEPRYHGDNPLILCFVDFESPAHAATAMDALQGYLFDEEDPESVKLRMQFARQPGFRAGGGHRGRR